MRVKKESQLGLLMRETAIKSTISQNMKQSYVEDPNYLDQVDLRNHVHDRFMNGDFKDYLITEKVKDIASKIKVNDSFDYSFLSKAKTRSASYLMGWDLLYRYFIEGDFLRIFRLRITGTTPGADGLPMEYDIFTVDLKTGRLLEERPKFKGIAQEFARLMIFIELTDVELKLVKPKQKIGSRKEGYKNDTELPFTVVDTSWNSVSIRTEGFTVSGHLRVQPCGKDRKDRKLVWIEAFEKKGYTRRRK